MFKFATTLTEGKRFSCYPITLFAMQYAVEVACMAKAEFAVSKKVMKKAVHRNRAKRQMRAAYREIMRTITLTTNTHLIFFFSAKENLSYHEIKSAMILAIEQFHTSTKTITL